MSEQEKPEGLDLESAGVLETKEEKLDAMTEASEDEIMQVIFRSMEAIQEMMYQCNAAVTALSARVDTLESFVGHFVEKDQELKSKLLAAKKEAEVEAEAVEKYGEVGSDPGLQGQLLRDLGNQGPTDEALLKELQKAGVVPQDAELLNNEKDDDESGDEKKV